MPRHDVDFYGWAYEQAALLRQGEFAQLDLPNIIDEIQSLAQNERRILRELLTFLLHHLLAWQAGPAWRTRKRRCDIAEQRIRIQNHLRESPSLSPELPGLYQDAYQRASRLAQIETELPATAFPATNLWPPALAMDDSFLPE